MRKVIGRRRTAMVSGFVILSLAALPGVVAAAPNTTPNGYCGALNMVEAAGVGAQGGMLHAMSVDNANGNTGMWIAVGASACE